MTILTARFAQRSDLQAVVDELLDFGFAREELTLCGRDGATELSLCTDDERAEHIAEILTSHNADQVERRFEPPRMSGWVRPAEDPHELALHARALDDPWRDLEGALTDGHDPSIYADQSRSTAARIFNPSPRDWKRDPA